MKNLKRLKEPHNNYLISEDGRLFRESSRKRAKGKLYELKGELHQGYKRFSLCKNYEKTRIFAHVLVAEYFLDEKPEEKDLVLHKDADKLNNHKDNLYWGDYADNAQDMAKHGNCRKQKLSVEDVKQIRRLCMDGYKNGELAEMFGVCESNISQIRNYKSWKHI